MTVRNISAPTDFRCVSNDLVDAVMRGNAALAEAAALARSTTPGASAVERGLKKKRSLWKLFGRRPKPSAAESTSHSLASSSCGSPSVEKLTDGLVSPTDALPIPASRTDGIDSSSASITSATSTPSHNSPIHPRLLRQQQSLATLRPGSHRDTLGGGFRSVSACTDRPSTAAAGGLANRTRPFYLHGRAIASATLLVGPGSAIGSSKLHGHRASPCSSPSVETESFSFEDGRSFSAHESVAVAWLTPTGRKPVGAMD